MGMESYNSLDLLSILTIVISLVCSFIFNILEIYILSFIFLGLFFIVFEKYIFYSNYICSQYLFYSILVLILSI